MSRNKISLEQRIILRTNSINQQTPESGSSRLCADRLDLESSTGKIRAHGFNCGFDAHAGEGSTYDASGEVEKLVSLVTTLASDRFFDSQVASVLECHLYHAHG